MIEVGKLLLALLFGLLKEVKADWFNKGVFEVEEGDLIRGCGFLPNEANDFKRSNGFELFSEALEGAEEAELLIEELMIDLILSVPLVVSVLL